MIEVRWERNEHPVGSSTAGWRAYVGTHYVGSVYVDGDSFFGPEPERFCRPITSVPLAAQALIAYVQAGGR